MRLIVPFLIWPLAEIAVLVLAGGWIGLWPVLGIVIGTGIFGVSLLRRGGMRSVADLRGQVAGVRGGLAGVAQGALTVVAGVLLFLPGLLGDLAGLILLIPAVQGLVVRLLGVWVAGVTAQMAARAGGPVAGDAGTVIDGTFDVVEPDKKPTHLPSGWTRH